MRAIAGAILVLAAAIFVCTGAVLVAIRADDGGGFIIIVGAAIGISGIGIICFANDPPGH